MKIISLFSGAGGLDLGLIKAGHQVVWANDICEDAVETYKANIGNNIVCADIKDIDITTIPDGDVVVGGFPCQGFSVANMRRNIEDERNYLYRFFYDTIKIKQPRFFIAENVKGILSLGKGSVIKQITEDFIEAGYIVDIHKVNMADYGIPQHRERVIIIGQRKDIADAMIFPFPQASHSSNPSSGELQHISIKQALERAVLIENDPNSVYSNYKVVYKNFTAHRKTDPNKPSPTILARGNGKGGVCAIPHFNGERRLSVRESAIIQTFPTDFIFKGSMGSCYRQIGNAVPVEFGRLLGKALLLCE